MYIRQKNGMGTNKRLAGMEMGIGMRLKLTVMGRNGKAESHFRTPPVCSDHANYSHPVQVGKYL